MWTSRGQSQSSSSIEVNFLNVCKSIVRSIEDLVNGGNLLNRRQCLDLSSKLSKTLLNIQDLVLHSCGGASGVIFRPALENLYRSLKKAEVLVQNCGKKDWWVAAVLQIQNENAFREILLDVGLCYNAIYEQAKSNGEDWNECSEDLRQSSLFQPATDSDIQEDQQDLRKRLEDLANESNSVKRLNRFLAGKGALKQCLARYLLLELNYSSEQSVHSQANTLDSCSAVMWLKETEPSGTWGNSHYLGAGANRGGVCSTEWMGIPCAKKEFHGQEVEELFLKEASILAQLKHPHIVNFMCCGNGQERGDRFIAMELMEKSLLDLIEDQKKQHFPISVVLDIIVQIARGMCYLHDRGIAHRDLKPQNVVVNRLTYLHLGDYFDLKLVDFGMSKIKVHASESDTISVRGVGTTRYRAPEVHPNAYLNGKGKAIWFKADIYSFGVTCAHFLSLETPFGDMEHLCDLHEGLKKGWRPELPRNCPEELAVLMRDCWKTDPRSRPSFIEVCTRLEIFRHKILRGFSSLHQGLQEDSIDSSTSFDFIKTKLEEQSAAVQNPLVDNSDDEVEDGNSNDDVVSIIPCTCGRALELLPQPPLSYSSSCSCDICCKSIDAEVYHCGTCHFDAHPDCVEIKDKVMVFFHHHRLHLLVKYYHDNDQDVICRLCEKLVRGSEWVYNCEQCNFDVHALCTKYPEEMDVIGRHPHRLALRECLPHKNLSCSCCIGSLKGYRYTCTQKWCTFDLHPRCAIRPDQPLCIFDSSHRLNLNTVLQIFLCSKCGTLGYSWLYYCDHCSVCIHLDCLDDMEEDGDYWSGAHEEFMLNYGNKEDHAKMDMITELLDRLLVSDTLEASSSSSSRPLPATTVRVRPTIPRLTSSERSYIKLVASDEVNLHKNIAAETDERQAKKMAAMEARQKLKPKSLEVLENLENIALDLQSSKNMSQADAEVLAANLKKIKRIQDTLQEGKAVQELAKMRQGPRIGLYYQRKTIFEPRKLLTSLQADMKNVFLLLLCEEPGHEHIADGASGWRSRGVLKAERWEKIQPSLDSGLQVVTREMSTLAAQLTEPDPDSQTFGWDLQAVFDLEEHSKRSRNPCKAEMDASKKAEDSAAEWLLRYLESMGVNIFKSFRLRRVRYTVTEVAHSPRYSRSALAWLCTDHLNGGLEAGTLESYPLQMYHNRDYDEQRGYDEN